MTIRSSVGSRLNEIDSLEASGATRSLLDKSYLSELQDLEPAEAISEFLRRQTALQATRQTFARLHSISPFNYL